MAGLLDMFGGSASDPASLYGGLLSPQQNAALSYRGLLAAAGALGQAAMPSRMPVPLGAALGSAASAMGNAQDEAAMNAMRGQLLGLQGKQLGWHMQMGQTLLDRINALTNGGGGTASASGGGEVGSPAPNASVSSAPIASGTGGGSNWETQHNNFAGMRIPGIIAGPNSGGFQAFDTPEAGVAAISHQLDRYASGATTGKPLTTLRQIISTWAPPSENDTGALIGRATKVMGVDADTPLDLTNADTKAKLVEAMIRNEQGGNLPTAAAAAIPKVFNTPSFTPYGGKPTQVAQADTGTVTDAMPQGLLAPQAPGSDTLRVGGGILPQTASAPPAAPAPQGLLAPQATQIAAQPSGAPAAPSAPMGGRMSPMADPRTVLSLGILGDIAGYPSVGQILQGTPQYKGAVAAAEALGKAPLTAVRPNGSFPRFDQQGNVIGWTQAPGMPTPTTVFDANGAGHPGFLTPPSSAGGASLNLVPGGFTTKLSPQQEAGGAKAGEIGAENAPGAVPPPSPAPSTATQSAAPGTRLAPNMTSTVPNYKEPAYSANDIKQSGEGWAKDRNALMQSYGDAQTAEQRLMTVASVYKAVQSGSFTTQLSEINAALKAAGFGPIAPNANPADVEKALHGMYVGTLQTLKASTSRFTQMEFRGLQENSSNPNLQPEANLEMIATDIGNLRRTMARSSDYLNAGGPVAHKDPAQFATEWDRANPTQAVVDAVKQEIGPFKGMNGTKPIDQATRDAAQNAILRGAPRDAVIQRLQQNGFDASKF